MFRKSSEFSLKSVKNICTTVFEASPCDIKKDQAIKLYDNLKKDNVPFETQLNHLTLSVPTRALIGFIKSDYKTLDEFLNKSDFIYELNKGLCGRFDALSKPQVCVKKVKVNSALLQTWGISNACANDNSKMANLFLITRKPTLPLDTFDKASSSESESIEKLCQSLFNLNITQSDAKKLICKSFHVNSKRCPKKSLASRMLMLYATNPVYANKLFKDYLDDYNAKMRENSLVMPGTSTPGMTK